MSDPIQFLPPRVPFLDKRTGLIAREWYLFLQGVFTRIGGSTGTGTADLALSMPDDAGIEETKAALYTSTNAVFSAPVPQEHTQIQHVLTELNELRAKVAVLERDLLALQQLPV